MRFRKTDPTPPPEPVDPVGWSAWKGIKPGIHSGFGSVDVAYSRSSPPAGEVSGSIKLQGWKGERVHCQLLVWSADSAEHVRLSVGGFRGEQSQIDKEGVSLSVIGYVLTDDFPAYVPCVPLFS